MDLRPNPSPEEIAKQADSTGVSRADWVGRTSDRSAGSAKALLAEFARSGDERVFEEVVRRYAGMVHAVCVRITKDAHDAEDATQAVFLALAMHVKTRQDQPIRYLGPWLQQVARRLSLDMRRSKGRRKKREAKLGEMEQQRLGIGFLSDDRPAHGGRSAALTDAFPGAIDKLDQDELRHLISSELEKLPAKYRLPLILHYFGGMSREEMSKELGVKPNTLGVRVFRGRELLGKRLAERGIVLSGAVLLVLLEETIRAGIGDAWVSAAAHAASATAHAAGATAHAAGAMSTATPSVAATTQVAGIMRAVARGIMLSRLKVVGIAILLLATVSAGGSEMAGKVIQQIKQHLQFNIAEHMKRFFESLTVPHLTADARQLEQDIDSELVIASHRDRSSRGHTLESIAPVVYSSEQMLVASDTFAGWPAPLEQASLTRAARVSADLLKKNAGAAAPPEKDVPVVLGVRRDGAVLQSTASSTERAVAILDGPKGAPVVQTLGAQQVLRSSGMIVGDVGSAAFVQSGASSLNRVDGDLSLGRSLRSKGRYELTGAGARLQVTGDEVIGDGGYGEFIHTDGANIVGQTLIVGKTGHGSYEQSGGDTTAGGGLVVAAEPGSVGTFSLAGGTVIADPQMIGKNGNGSLTQSGGTNTARTVWVASDRGSKGTYSLPRGVLALDELANVTDADVFKPTDGHAGINVGGAGDGSFRLGDINKQAKIIERQSGSYLAVRAKQTGSGTFRGWGDVAITGEVINNGQIIADGYGAKHTLDLSSASDVVNTIENISTANGWYARNGGQLILPPIKVHEGSANYSWGESGRDALPDLVNSVRLHVAGALDEGEIHISLVALDRAGQDAPRFPSGHHFIGLWSFDTDVDLTSVDFAIRYDDALAASMDINENILKFWAYEPTEGGWVRINDASFRRYPTLNIITGQPTSDFTYFAVSAPEPVLLAPFALGGFLLLRRKRV